MKDDYINANSVKTIDEDGAEAQFVAIPFRYVRRVVKQLHVYKECYLTPKSREVRDDGWVRLLILSQPGDWEWSDWMPGETRLRIIPSEDDRSVKDGSLSRKQPIRFRGVSIE